ncbi:pyrroloquinoline quinone biosynthesis protein B [Tenacibaculum sp. MAR_2009_124]|uniref:MBL fold metallo-hydrolase n=1 Tax=Tenacibaculum sp. MAR_2009_124 TaxID=1250059 RepID=UPI000898C537|nr:MBL fold metallo-hydrolase [Tenacibaculum sp. MAR_2009_124]SEB38241.1 pyrroloquinoline quinone biosynthesis protein B [Tenacibaculum sp. MAR_2009_124]
MKVRYFISLLSFVLLANCQQKKIKKIAKIPKEPFFVVLGVAQDAGYPQIACLKTCCEKTRVNPQSERMVSCIGLVDPTSNQSWIFDATPDFTQQTELLSSYTPNKTLPDGVFLSHGHIGHYTGVMYLGREAMSANRTPVYTMPRMLNYLSNNGPWSQLVTNKNIQLKPLVKDSLQVLNERISVVPLEVPHRDEYTETVGFEIHYKEKKALFIPDIDKWEKWDRSILDYIKKVDIAFLDATFFKNGEINRDMSEVPHPFVEESMKLFSQLSKKDKNKVHFIHFNHTNPLLDESSEAFKSVLENNFKVAVEKSIVTF